MAKEWDKLVKRVKALEKQIAKLVSGKKPATKKAKRNKTKKKAKKVTAPVAMAKHTKPSMAQTTKATKLARRKTNKAPVIDPAFPASVPPVLMP